MSAQVEEIGRKWRVGRGGVQPGEGGGNVAQVEGGVRGWACLGDFLKLL